MTPTDLPEQPVEVWPDAWPAFRLFEALGTQWRQGSGRPTGLDYGVVPAVASMLGIERHVMAALFSDLRVMEAEALAAMAETAE
ncbi:DUF1799 domain-containing protein [Pseudomonas monteilii]|uniref:DUF1799 domain-containing protein n=1 Tax=Pseudomonas alabamensis TaxID=3064349 RepID=UPI00350EF6C1